MKRLLLVFIGSMAFTAATASALPPVIDSVGVEKKDGKLYVLHRIGEGQTLYSLVRRYKTSIQAIREANPGLTDNVRYDQVVRVPVPNLARREEKAIEKAIKKEEKAQRKDEKKEEKEIAKIEKRPETAAKPAERRPEGANPNNGIHQVEAGQTLYSLSNRYGVSMEDLRRWNSLKADKVVAGQPLIVSERAWLDRTPGAKVATTKTNQAAAKPESTQVEPPRVSNRPDGTRPDKPTESRPRPAEEVAVADRARTEAPRPAEAEPTASTEPRVIRPGDTDPLPGSASSARRISEIGIAELIDQNDNSNKYLALHRTAPIGTLVLVRNDMNKQAIWVKVIGRLPATSINDRVIIKISARAFEKLSPADRRFRAEVSYLLQ